MASSKAAHSAIGHYMPHDWSDEGDLFSDEENSKSTRKNSGDKDGETAGLGIDEEVDVKTRVRVPRVKLDEARLLSDKGIPALRKRAQNLRLKGKGHEFSDIARMLSMYQLWLDDLFPKARFADALAMVEKQGHKATMHKMRMEWINEAKPRDANDKEDMEVDKQPAPEAAATSAATAAATAAPAMPTEQLQQQDGRPQLQATGARPTTPGDVPTEDDIFDEVDMYGASPARPAAAPTQNMPIRPADDMDAVPDDDELDALMAEVMEAPGPANERRKDNGSKAPLPGRAAFDDGEVDFDALIAEAEAA